MAIELTGPGNCAECSTELTTETILAGDAGPFVFTVRGHSFEVPGLYVCTPCAGAIMAGEKESGVTWQAARDFLNDTFGPKVVGFAMLRGDDPAEMAMAAKRLADIMETQALLEALIALQDEGEDFSFIPECKGDCGKEHEPHPSEMAHLN